MIINDFWTPFLSLYLTVILTCGRLYGIPSGLKGLGPTLFVPVWNAKRRRLRVMRRSKISMHTQFAHTRSEHIAQVRILTYVRQFFGLTAYVFVNRRVFVTPFPPVQSSFHDTHIICVNRFVHWPTQVSQNNPVQHHSFHSFILPKNVPAQTTTRTYLTPVKVSTDTLLSHPLITTFIRWNLTNSLQLSNLNQI